MTTSARWLDEIESACAERDWALSNRLITGLHYRLSEALVEKMGRDAGPNFHSWAVWGSRKAGETIRQEDLDDAIRNATVTAGVVGSLVGVVMGRWLGGSRKSLCGVTGAGLGAFAGAWTGREIAVWSRVKAAELILQGNRLVLRDIGTQSARFLVLLEEGATPEGRRMFFAGLQGAGTERLVAAFTHYLRAWDTTDLGAAREAMIAGNCEAVYHEHLQLEPYIRSAMPWIVRRCATQRMMTFEIGEKVLTVGEDLPGSEGRTAARDWTRIEERMRYVFALFRAFHGEPRVFSVP